MKRAIFLDRDGVLNQAIIRDGKPFSPGSVDEMILASDAAAALGALKRGGFQLIMVTNQPDIARGKIARETVDAMNDHVRRALDLDAVEVCSHDDGDQCDCRKPAPGMLVRAAAREGIDLAESFMVGDRWRDIEAGRRAGCRAVLIGTGYGERETAPDMTAGSLMAAAEWILNQPGKVGKI